MAYLLKRMEIRNMRKRNVLDAICTTGIGENLAKSHNHVSDTLTFIPVTKIFVLKGINKISN